MKERGPSSAVRIVIVDDHTLFRESLHRLLSAEQGLVVVGEYSSAAGLLAAIESGLAFEVALIDFDLSASGVRQESGLDLLRKLSTLSPDVHILMVTAGMTNAGSQRVIQEFKAGLFLKTEPIAELILAIQRTSRGEQWISSSAVLSLLATADLPGQQQMDLTELSSREQEVLRGVLEGLSNKEIGHRLDLSESLVKAVLQRLFERTGVRTRSQLVRIAIERQIIFGSSLG